MMWRKAWLETRWKLALMALLDALILALLLEDGGSAAAWHARLAGAIPMLPIMNGVVLASAGIGTQTSFRPRQTLHPSMMFTLSLPIARWRLVLVREAVGALATAGLTAAMLTALWVASPGVRALLTPIQFAVYGIAVLASAAVAYGISAVLATLLDDLWQTYGALVSVAILVFALPPVRIWTGLLPGPEGSVSGASGAALEILLACALAGSLSLLSVKVVERRQF